MASVIIIFVLLPLFLTLMEEQSEAEAAQRHQYQVMSAHHDSNIIEHPFHSHPDSSA